MTENTATEIWGTGEGDVLLWLDVETTGLNAADDHLLEVAALVTDVNLSPIDEVGFHAVILHDAAQVRAAANDFVRDMHERSGLWARVGDPQVARPIDAVEHDLLAYVRRYAPERRQARLAGNSVRLDANFLDEHMPQVAEHLHYRLVDVTSLDYVVRSWLPDVPEPVKAHSHEAMADIRESLSQARLLRAAIRTAGEQS